MGALIDRSLSIFAGIRPYAAERGLEAADTGQRRKKDLPIQGCQKNLSKSTKSYKKVPKIELKFKIWYQILQKGTKN